MKDYSSEQKQAICDQWKPLINKLNTIVDDISFFYSFHDVDRARARGYRKMILGYIEKGDYEKLDVDNDILITAKENFTEINGFVDKRLKEAEEHRKHVENLMKPK